MLVIEHHQKDKCTLNAKPFSAALIFQIKLAYKILHVNIHNIKVVHDLKKEGTIWKSIIVQKKKKMNSFRRPHRRYPIFIYLLTAYKLKNAKKPVIQVIIQYILHTAVQLV